MGSGQLRPNSIQGVGRRPGNIRLASGRDRKEQSAGQILPEWDGTGSHDETGLSRYRMEAKEIMTLEEQINAGHDPEVVNPFQEIRQALEESRPDLIEDFTRIVERHEKMQRELYGAKAKIDNLSRSLYGKRRG